MDRTDLRCICAMLWTSIGVCLNLVFLQAVSSVQAPHAPLVLVPIFAGVAVGLSGLVRHMRERGRTMVFVDRVWMGSMLYLALSALTSFLYQPRLD